MMYSWTQHQLGSCTASLHLYWTSGRFLNRDTAGYNGGPNLSAAFGGNPVTKMDPDGTDWLNDVADFSAGAGDSLTFGATHWGRLWLGEAAGVGDANKEVHTASTVYNAGVWTEVAVEVVASGGSAGLKHLIEKGVAEAAAEGIARS